MSIRQDISKLDYWFVGEDQLFQWTIYQADDRTLQDITGWTIEFSMAPGAGGTSVLTKDATLVTPASGLCRVTVLDTETSSLAPRTYKYNLSRTNAGSNQVLAHGDAVLQARIDT